MPGHSSQGRSIGNYLLSKTIGEGTFGKVKLGVHLLTGERVAVKVLEKDRITDKGDVKRVTREIQILKHIQHPHVVNLLEVIEKPRHIYLVTEYVAGGELFEFIVAHGRLQETQACRIFRQVLVAVDACHALGVAHRDLKPENMLVDEECNIKLIDFGLSNTYDSPTALLRTACGSPCYAAPEMIAGKRYLGAAADLWSLGVCLFAMLCGYLPFEDPDTPALYKKILAGSYAVADHVSSDARDLLAGLLTTGTQAPHHSLSLSLSLFAFNPHLSSPHSHQPSVCAAELNRPCPPVHREGGLRAPLVLTSLRGASRASTITASRDDGFTHSDTHRSDDPGAARRLGHEQGLLRPVPQRAQAQPYNRGVLSAACEAPTHNAAILAHNSNYRTVTASAHWRGTTAASADLHDSTSSAQGLDGGDPPSSTTNQRNAAAAATASGRLVGAAATISPAAAVVGRAGVWRWWRRPARSQQRKPIQAASGKHNWCCCCNYNWRCGGRRCSCGWRRTAGTDRTARHGRLRGRRRQWRCVHRPTDYLDGSQSELS